MFPHALVFLEFTYEFYKFYCMFSCITINYVLTLPFAQYYVFFGEYLVAYAVFVLSDSLLYRIP